VVVMAGLVPAIHDLGSKEDVDARHKAGHDDVDRRRNFKWPSRKTH
jgi:hypothetical protein